MPVYLSKEQIFAVQDRKFEDVPVPEWGEGISVRVGTATAAWREHYEKVVVDARRTGELSNLRAHVCAACIVDENGDNIFSVGDVPMLAKKSGIALQRIFEVGSRLSVLSETAKAAQEKN